MKLFAALNPHDVYGITESWTDDRMTDALLDLPGYVLFRTDRPVNDDRSRGGGVLLYVRSALNPSYFSFPAPSYPEMSCCTFSLHNGESVLIVLIYRSDSNTYAQNSLLFSTLKSIAKLNFSHTVVFGDFNYKDISWSSFNWPAPCDEFMESVLESGLIQHVDFPTRGMNTLDLVFSNEPYTVVNTYAIPGIADHFAICFSLCVDSINMNCSSQARYLFGSTKWPAFRRTLQTLLHSKVMSANTSPSDFWTHMLNAVSRTINAVVPLSPPHVLRNAKPLWADRYCLAALSNERTKLRKFQRTLLPYDYSAYLAASEIASDETKRSIFRYESLLAANIKTDIKSFWKYVNSSLKSRPKIGPFRLPDGSFAQTDKLNADILAQFFASVYTIEATDPPNLVCISPNQLSTITFTEAKIALAIKHLKRFASPGHDGVSPIVIHECSDILAPYLSCLFQCLLDHMFVPESWKTCYVTPVHKKGSVNDTSNFRPICSPVAFSKLMESIIATEILEHLYDNRLLAKSQFGFLPRRSCLLQLLEFVHWIVSVINAKDCVDAIYLDLQKAFDRVPRKRLIAKLRAYGISGNLLCFIDNLLCNRRQIVTINGCHSEPYDVTSGVPQGSVIGPLLFLVYVDDLDLCISSVIRKFADDSKVFRRLHMSHPQLLELDCADLQLDLDALADWCRTWLMDFNVQKCACLHFGSNNPCTTYYLNGQAIPNKQSEKDLGVHISDSLKFSEHCADAVRRAEYALWCVKKSIKYMSKDIFLQLYKALIRPILEYASSVWCPHYRRDIDLIERVQRRATKLHGPARDLQYHERLRLLGIQTLQTRRYRNDLILLYKIMHGLVDLPESVLFNFAADTGIRGHNLKLRPHFKPQLDCARYSFGYRVVSAWNNLSSDVVNAPSVGIFKQRLHASGSIPEL
jgi:hypothetical protein